MRLFSYVVARDFGFAPNPFGGICTLATCKPKIRQAAAVGDWIVGLTSTKDKKTPSIIYVMRVDEVLTYDAYWNDPRFQYKKPSRFGSVKQLFGDNIYHRDHLSQWIQSDSHHSNSDGSTNQNNLKNDTKSEGVLVGKRFAYWGSSAIDIPTQFLHFKEYTLKTHRGHKVNYPSEFVHEFVSWFESLEAQGFLSPPFIWHRKHSSWSR